MRGLALVLLSFSLFAKTVVVSDIDDTLKVAHVRSKPGIILNAFRTKNIFLGMSDLLHTIKQDDDATIIYLTNAPERLMKTSHTKTLKNGKFPAGKIYLRKSGVDSKSHKPAALKEIIRIHNPSRMILWGDNGESDMHFYHNIMKENPGIEFITFIRQQNDPDKKHALYPEQFAYISSFEIAAVLEDQGVISSQSFNEHLDDHAKGFLASRITKRVGPMYIPRWTSCVGHKSPKELREAPEKLAQLIYRRISNICQ